MRSDTTNVFRIRTAEVTGTVKLSDHSIPLRGGDTVEVMAELEAPVALERGVRFSLPGGGKLVAFGIVTEVLT
jgi:elongation factor Tu